MEPRLRFVTGKGGVGKTTAAIALALAERRRGRRVLLCECNGGDRVTALLGRPPTQAQMREVLEDLFVVDMTPREAIREYVLLTLRFETLYKAVFENRLVRRFLRLVPSLSELVMLGKVWFHEQEQVDGRNRFDVIVVDAPATGHAISMLGTPAVVEVTVPPGPLRDNARVIHQLLTDPDRTCLHIVTTPEDMPTTEAGELAEAAETRLGMLLGETVVNQRVSPVPCSALTRLQSGPRSPRLAPVLQTLEGRERRRRAGEDYLERLPNALQRTRWWSLPRLVHVPHTEATYEHLADAMTLSPG